MIYVGRPAALEVQVIGERNSTSVTIAAKSCLRSARTEPISIGVKSLDDMRTHLVKGLSDLRTEGTFGKLKSLANLGYEAFNAITAPLAPEKRKRWLAVFNAPPDIRESVIRVRFEASVNFPFALLCTSKPNSDNYEQLAKKFLGARAVIINTSGRIETRSHDQIYVQDAPPCRIAHAVDGSVPGAELEIMYLGKVRGAEVSRCATKRELLSAWNRVRTGVVHFSSHHTYDQLDAQYVLSLNNGERFCAIRDLSGLRRNAKKGLPFLFLNGCNTGWMQPGKPDTFVGRLSPDHVVGVLTTLYSVGGEDAAKFAKRFYQYWMTRPFAIDALTAAKYSLMFKDNDFTAIAYEFWETPEALRLFERN